MIRAIIFDFDGVILESASIKTDAFAAIAQDYPNEQADAFVKYHMSHMGISRHVKFRYFIEEILGEPYSDEKEQILADKFSDIVFERVMHCDFVPGAKEFLENNYQQYELYIATGTPGEEIMQIIKGRNLQKYFKRVYGTPMKKEEIVDTIMEQYGYSAKEIVFVGDAGTDLKAAESRDLYFIGRNTPENTNDFRNIQFKVDDLRQMEQIIRSL